jgi:two-component system phosphate regulon sensor histidine kinase PhoR
LVENVLQSAVFEKEGFRLKIKSVDIHSRIDKAIASLSMQAQSRGVKIIKRLEASVHELEADEVMITNLIFNLIDNGIKYSKNDDPYIEIITRNEPGLLVLEIRDNGIGISKDDQKRIFEKLYRVPTGNVHNVKGFGLGLSYVKSIVERHHGTIEVKSQLGEGSTFIVKLPLKQQINNSLHLK